MKKVFQTPSNPSPRDTETAGESPLRDILEKPGARRSSDAAPATLIGNITRLNPDGSAEATYTWPEAQVHARRVRQTIPLDASTVGRECVLAFDRGEIDRPIVVGLLQPAGSAGRPLIIQADNGIVIQSGAARIELSEDGEINIQGLYINSQAYGPHRIKGGSVKIN